MIPLRITRRTRTRFLKPEGGSSTFFRAKPLVSVLSHSENNRGSTHDGTTLWNKTCHGIGSFEYTCHRETGALLRLSSSCHFPSWCGFRKFWRSSTTL